MVFLTILIGLSILGILIVALSIGKRGTISQTDQKKVLRIWNHANTLEDNNHKILEAEKAVDFLFSSLGLQGSFAQKLKKIEAYVPDKEYVWAAHKLRNRIAHEPEFSAPARETKYALKAFEKVIYKYCR